MRVSVHTMTVEAFVPMLQSLSKMLDKAAQYASTKKFDPAVLAQARLAPDMFAFVKQVQLTCDFAKNSTARLTAQEAPRFEDTEQTLDELKTRIARTIDYLQSVKPQALEGAEDRDIKIPLPNNHSLEMKGLPFLRGWALPNFYFHLVTAYDILRHNGVEVGKRDYLNAV
jgi:uncharacterized protein